MSSIGVVSGATYKDQALSLRKLLPSAPFLIPGFGAQGASASDKTNLEKINNPKIACAPLKLDTFYPGLRNFGLINSSRGVLFPEKSYMANNIQEWQDIILTELNETNNKLINNEDSETV